MAERTVIGVDMGGTKIHAGLITEQQLIRDCVRETPAREAEQVVTKKLIETIENIFESNCEGIGIGVPSVVDAQKGIVYDVVAIQSWKEVHLKEILEKHFRVPVYVNNDSNCFALGEKYFGKGRGCANFVAATIGTGFGSGIIINHKLYGGVNTGAGEVGCVPYKDGMLEHYCASLFFKKHGADGIKVSEAARQGDAHAVKLFDEFGGHVAHAIKVILYTIDPELIILGGSISNSYDLFIDSVWKHLDDFLFPTVLKNLKIEKSDLKNSALLGAAGLVFNENN